MYPLKITCKVYKHNEHVMYINTMNMLCIYYNELVMYIIKYFLLIICSHAKFKITITLYNFTFFYYRVCIAQKKLPFW